MKKINVYSLTKLQISIWYSSADTFNRQAERDRRIFAKAKNYFLDIKDKNHNSVSDRKNTKNLIFHCVIYILVGRITMAPLI